MKMRNVETGMVLEIEAHAILKNCWEYYFIKESNSRHPIKYALVEGFAQEIGDVDLEEIQPYLLTLTMDLNDVMPAPGWEWVTSTEPVRT